MAGYAMNKASFFLATLAFAGLSACSPNGGGSNSVQEAPLAGARIGAPFTLTDQDGKSVSWDSFKGKYRIVYFGYTFCPDVCPVDLQKIMQAFTRFEKQKPALSAKVQPIFISVDPERDTVPVIKNYVTAFHPRLIGLTGRPEQIAKVAKDFAVIYSKESEGENYLVSHSRTPYLFGPQGNPIALIPVGENAEATPDAILATLDQWVK
ncbi:SCO family protein [Sphingobium sp. SCG-1]|uniref:SCO family protein n=1 Tax=Sphingobium sp. SCG-1 TaxID=2072936 RepID=UPI000CD68FF0|nr:SCO family protein [Sphingobium sp. SCG-1]AUW57538.1 SCO family protein [Sphingobium sp. SCG-1]